MKIQLFPCSSVGRAVRCEKLAALKGNLEMRSGLNQGTPPKIAADNPELALHLMSEGSSDKIVKILPKQSLRIGARASAETLHPLPDCV